jgi:hypothetical protein
VCGKEDGRSLSYTLDGSWVWQVWLVWPWPRPSWTTLYTCAATKFVLFVLFWNRFILLCFLPVYFQKLLWLKLSWTTLYTHCTHVQQVQMMRLRRVVLYSPVQLNTTWRQPDVSFVYETSPTFRWLEIEIEMMNCHLLTTPLLTWGAWGKASLTDRNTHRAVCWSFASTEPKLKNILYCFILCFRWSRDNREIMVSGKMQLKA